MTVISRIGPDFIMPFDINRCIPKIRFFFQCLAESGSAFHLLDPLGEIPPYQVGNRLLKSGMAGPLLKDLFLARVIDC
jgi:hypothetical protein